jgi:hypothetical protein
VTRRAAQVAGWCATGAIVVLGARWIAYALAPQTLVALELKQSLGGPSPVVIAVVALGIALAVSASAVGIAALALRERMMLEPALAVERPQLRPGRLLLRVAFLWMTTCLGFAYLESYLHWRQGLGWHGIDCLVGPVHRDAIPILGALSLVAVALRLCAEHLVAWMRRTVRRLLARPVWRVARVGGNALPARVRIPHDLFRSFSRPRGPPLRPVVEPS